MDIYEFLLARFAEEEADAKAGMEFTTGSWELMASATVYMPPRASQEAALAARGVDAALGNVVTGAERREAARNGTWDGVFSPDSDAGAAAHIVRWDPARVLAEVAAKRAIVEEHGPADDGSGMLFICRTCSRRDLPEWYGEYVPCPTSRIVAAPYADHPDYDKSWRIT